MIVDRYCTENPLKRKCVADFFFLRFLTSDLREGAHFFKMFDGKLGPKTSGFLMAFGGPTLGK